MAVTAVTRGIQTRGRPTWLAWGLWTLTMLGLVVLVWLDQLLRQTDQPELVVLNPTAFAPVLGAVSTATVGQWWPAAGLLIAYQAAFAVIVAFVGSAWSLVGRFRRARGVERQQLRWVALATVLIAMLAVVNLAAFALGAYALAPLVGGLNPPILSAGIGAAILRYRLYDLDRIISRTLAYGLLTLLLGGGYALVVLGLGQLLGRDSPLVVAAATLAVAAVFQPARRRVQQVVDRRFNRRRHDATRIIEAFSTRLRDQVDLDTLTAELLGWSTRPCCQPRHRCGCGHRKNLHAHPRCPSPAITPWNQQARREGFEPPTARPVAWCSTSIWSAPDGSGLLTLDGSSIWTDPAGSRRIVCMIKRMIKRVGQFGDGRWRDAMPAGVPTAEGSARHRPVLQQRRFSGWRDPRRRSGRSRRQAGRSSTGARP